MLEITDLTETEIWEQIYQLMEEGLGAANADGYAPAAPFRLVERRLNELVRRDPEWNCSEIAELRDVLDCSLRGECARTGHA